MKLKSLQARLDVTPLNFRNITRLRFGSTLTQTGPPSAQSSLPALQTDHPALEGPRRPGGRGHLRAHVSVRAGVGPPHGAHQRPSVLALVAAVPPGVGADRRAVRVGEAVRRVRAAGGEGGAVRGALSPAVVPGQAVGLVGRLAGLQVGQGGQHGRDPGGGDVHRGAGRGVDVVPSVVGVRGLVGGQGQALVHSETFSLNTNRRKTDGDPTVP